MRSFFLLATVLLIALSGAPLGAEKITVDPNAGAQAQMQTTDEDADGRVAQKVTVQAERKAVSAILDDLSKQTGVTLKAGMNKNDWQVRDRRMNVFCKDTTLAALMNSISRVMKFKWAKEKTKDGTIFYRLYMDRRTLLDAEAQKAREEERLAKLQAEHRQRAMNAYAEVAGMSADDLAGLRHESPFRYMMGSLGLAKPMSGLFAEAPALAQALSSDQPADIAASSLSPQGQGHLIETWRALHKLISVVEKHAPAFPDDPASIMDGLSIRVRSNPYTLSGAPPSVLGELEISENGRRQMEFPLIDPDSSVGKLFGDLILECIETGKDANDVEKQFQDRIGPAFVADIKEGSPDDPVKQRPDDPALRAEVKIKPVSDKLADIQRALAEASGTAVVSDSFRQHIPVVVPRDTEMELGDLLDKFGEGFRYDWDKPASVIEFRDKRWFAKRSAQIPEVWLEAWRNKLKTTGTLEFDDLARICSLTREEMEENIYEDRTLIESGVTTGYFLGHDLFTFYNSLNESQRAAAMTEAGLDLTLLNPDQWAKAAKAAKSRNPSVQPTTEILKRLTIALDKHGSYQICIGSGDDVVACHWSVRAPKYVEVEEPKEPKQANAGGDNKPEPR